MAAANKKDVAGKYHLRVRRVLTYAASTIVNEVLMPAAEARACLLEKFANLSVIRKQGSVWRTTTRGTPWVMLGWGYREGSIYYNLHVHGKLNAHNSYVPTADEPKIRSSDSTQEIHLSEHQFILIRNTANAVIAAAVKA